MQLFVVDCGISDYSTLWDVQKQILSARVKGLIPDVLLTTEHTHVYTIGKTSDPNHLVAPRDFLRKKNIDVVATDRGGGITYHGPGQLVVYPIISLENYGRDIHQYLRMLEQSIINMLGVFGIEARQDSDYTGVWVRENKIASIGIKVSHWVTMHGAAINIATNLSYFEGIIACGIFHKGLTSMSEVLARNVSVREVKDVFVKTFSDVFQLQFTEIELDQLRRHIEPALELV